MIIKRIILHNLASIDDAVVDFTLPPLANEPLFLINGPTGSGKSTILDAVCLALFGETPRLHDANERSVAFSIPYRTKEKGNMVVKEQKMSLGDTSQIMRRGTAECYAAVVFTTQDNVDYEAKWYVNKANKRIDGKIQRPVSTLTNLKTGVVVGKDTAQEVEKLIHLNFEQFCRTSMLAQGEFTKFLQSNSSEKSQILEKLTGTEIYSNISKIIADINSQKKNEVEKAKLLIDNIALFSDEQKKDINLRIDNLETLLQQLSSQRNEVSAKAQWLQDSLDVDRDMNNVQILLLNAEKTKNDPVYQQENRFVELFRLTEAPRRWLAERNNRIEAVQKAEGKTEQFANNYGKLLAAFIALSQNQDKDAKDCSEWKNKLVKWMPFRDMLLHEQTIVQQLQQTEALLDRAENRMKDAHKMQAKEPFLDNDITTAQKTLHEAEERVDKALFTIKKVENEIIAMKPEELEARKLLLNERKKAVGDVLSDLPIFDMRHQALNDKLQALENAKKEVERISASLPLLRRDEEHASEAHNSAARVYELMKESIHTHFISVRHKLQKGDVCPLCGQTVDSCQMPDENFKEVVRPLEKKYEETKEKLTLSKSKTLAAKEGLTKATKNLSDADKAVKKEQAAHDTFLQLAVEHYKSLTGFDFSLQEYIDNVVSVRETAHEMDRLLVADEAALDNELQLLQNKNREMISLQKEKDVLMDNRTKAERALNKAKQALIDLKRDTSIALDEVEKCKVDAENLLDKVDDLMAISQWREKWLANKRGFTNQLKMDADSMNLAEEKVRLISQQMELRHNHLVMMKSTQDILLAMMPEWIGMDTSCYAVEGTVAPDVLAAGWTALQNNVRKWKTEIDTLSKQINGYNDSLMRFYNDNPEVDESAVLRLMEFSPYQIAEMEERHQRMEQSIASFKGQIKQLTEKRTHLDENRPEINPDDTVESLKELARTCETSMLHKQQELGGLRNQLNEDSRKRQNKETALKQFEILKMDAQNWKLFNDEFGSADGSKFRKIAQSFLLNHLLVKANSYLRHFTDRYELVGEPGSLAILVSDRYTKLPPQYVKILSGGETFMVSLSLALALAQLNDTPSAVDTIFIDEGFGSLDPQSLSDVMDTLEKLHQIGGRRVGIISHVEELKRRIAVQVNVQRVDPTRSKVTITT